METRPAATRSPCPACPSSSCARPSAGGRGRSRGVAGTSRSERFLGDTYEEEALYHKRSHPTQATADGDERDPTLMPSHRPYAHALGAINAEPNLPIWSWSFSAPRDSFEGRPGLKDLGASTTQILRSAAVSEAPPSHKPSRINLFDDCKDDFESWRPIWHHEERSMNFAADEAEPTTLMKGKGLDSIELHRSAP